MQEHPPIRYAIALHGGAGTISRDQPARAIGLCRNGLGEALTVGKTILEDGGAGLDAVEAVVRNLEDNPLFNAGRGAAFTRNGKHELDASIMNGRTLHCGAVACAKTVRNPVTLARRVMERTDHVLLAGEGAEAFAAEVGVERADPAYFHTGHRFRQLQRAHEQGAIKDPEAGASEHGTVGCVALDLHGDLAAATSTGGMTGKRPGRVGDSPVIGAGTYADNRTCAISCTGVGEQFMRHVAAFRISALMEYGEKSLEEAVRIVLHERLDRGDGGVIGVGRDGRIVLDYNSEGMYRAAADSEGRFDVRIWEE